MIQQAVVLVYHEYHMIRVKQLMALSGVGVFIFDQILCTCMYRTRYMVVYTSYMY